MKILDIGGSMAQRKDVQVDTLVDIIRPEEAPYGPSKLLAKHFIKLDITRQKLPFKDKEFDFCYCTHTLEDLPTPFVVMEEMERVAKAGLIITPSMGEDMKFSHIDYADWKTGARRVPGHAHHKWFFVNNGEELIVIPKNFPILFTSEFQIVEWYGESEMVYKWKGKIKYSEVKGLRIHDLIDEYRKFMKVNAKAIKRGTSLIFLDNPYFYLKAILKRLFKR